VSTSEPPPYPGEPESGDENSALDPPTPPFEPPSPASAGAGQFSAPDAIVWGWGKFSHNVGAVLVATLVVILSGTLVMFALTGVTALLFSGPSPWSLRALGAGLTRPGDMAISIAVYTVGFTLAGVLAKAALDVADGLPFDFFGAFAKINFGQLFLASLIVSVCVIVGQSLCLLPGLVAAFFLYFTSYSVVDAGTPAIDAIQRSVSLVSSNLGDALLLFLLNIVVTIAGAIACGVGLLVAIPVTVFATAYAYRAFNHQPVAS
jgi:uncharacterized membrane protein